MKLEVDGENEDYGIWSGWHIKSKHDNYDDYFEPLYLADGDKVTHWQQLPEPPKE